MSGAAYYLKFDEIVDLIGQESAEALIGHLGGTRFYVREKLPPDHPIVIAIGADAAMKFAAHMATGIGGLAVELPTHRSGEFTGYRRHLREVVAKSDRSEAALAAELGVHGRTIRRMRAKLRQERQAKIEKAVLAAE
ncbi:hypothetical protein [Methylobacterium sp. Leaf108]|uniref:hypothetical protein n=1 Tax=Methylobacterium sp. Leaf108 TaxID=1736256 RepID=UPI0006F1CCCE|nr:hypothetical protein [Methylobacterium sp. Leaf108]KQP48976.1 hypothetical protein ASF39_14600 [Methylobacterium sp. Leaf108]